MTAFEIGAGSALIAAIALRSHAKELDELGVDKPEDPSFITVHRRNFRQEAEILREVADVLDPRGAPAKEPPRTQEEPEGPAGWAREHAQTKGEHFGLTGPGTSAFANCPLCPGDLPGDAFDPSDPSTWPTDKTETTWGEALGIDEGPGFYATPEDRA